MTVTTEHLTRVSEFAAAQGFDKTQAISAMILLLTKRFGYEFNVAYDAILGQGAYQQTADLTYEALKG